MLNQEIYDRKFKMNNIGGTTFVLDIKRFVDFLKLSISYNKTI